ncbi:MAG: IPT/TIG domain-containing protein [Deltaproteobacteria bacterium]|nr:IPT/TIG domain-containing protein [Deltaproteobacteria bacterium]
MYPTTGAGGTQIVVRGTGFVSGDEVLIGDRVTIMRGTRGDHIIVVVPMGASSGRISIRRQGRLYPSSVDFRILAVPMVSYYTPHGGSPGETISLRGINLTADATVNLSGISCPVVRRTVPTELLIVVPQNARTGRIVITTTGGSWVSPRDFEVLSHPTLSSFSPTQGAPGTRVTLYGQNFHHGMRVFLGSTQLPIVAIQPSLVVVVIPQGVYTGNFVIFSRNRSQQSTSSFTVLNIAELTFHFSPVEAAAGSDVTIRLSRAEPAATIWYNGRPLPKRVLHGGRTFVVTVPGDATSGYFELEVSGRKWRATQQLTVR